MANQTRDYLSHDAQRTADTVVGEIVERMSNGTYRYREIGTGAERFASPPPGQQFAVGSRVTIGRPGASGSMIGSQDVILTPAPKEQRGLSGTTPAVERTSADRVLVISVEPDPLVLVVGGDPGVQTITGHGFTVAATYGGAGVTDAAAATITDTEIVMTLAADVGAGLGEFDADVSGVAIPLALRIVAPPVPAGDGLVFERWSVFVLSSAIVVVARDDTFATVRAWAINPSTLALFSTASFNAPDGETVDLQPPSFVPGDASTAIQKSGSLRVIMKQTGGTPTVRPRLVSVSAAGGMSVDDLPLDFDISTGCLTPLSDADTHGYFANMAGPAPGQVQIGRMPADLSEIISQAITSDGGESCYVGADRFVFWDSFATSSFVLRALGGDGSNLGDFLDVPNGRALAERAWTSGEGGGYGDFNGKFLTHSTAGTVQRYATASGAITTSGGSLSSVAYVCQWRDKWLCVLADTSVVVTDFTTTTELSAAEADVVGIAADQAETIARLLIAGNPPTIRNLAIV